MSTNPTDAYKEPIPCQSIGCTQPLFARGQCKEHYQERGRAIVLAGCENQKRKIERGEAVDPHELLRKQIRAQRKPANDTPTEYKEQLTVCRFLRAKGLDFFAVPNGGARKGGAIEGNMLKHIGVSAGVPDLLILDAPPKYPDARGVALEMKREKGGTVSEHQKAWLLRFSEQNWVTYVAHGADDAIDWLTKELGF
jgi:hypothetical protein